MSLQKLSSKQESMGRRQSQEKLSSDIMAKKPLQHSLPDDIVYEILVNLPVKTLIMFKCVSKSWHSIISHPSFQQEHFLRRSQQDPLLLLTRFEVDMVSYRSTLHFSTHNCNKGTLINNFSTIVPGNYTQPVENPSCQGLVCFIDAIEEDIFLCNPSTREIITLPPNNFPIQNIGFGYAASTREFKVIAFFDYGGTEAKHPCEVLTVGTSKWRKAKFPPQYQGPFYMGAPFLQGAVHLLPLLKHPNGDDCIHAFDIESEEFASVSLPDSYHSIKSSPANTKFTKLGGSLCLSFQFNTSMELWLLKDYHCRKWVKEYTIDLTSLGFNVWGALVLLCMGDGSILLAIRDKILYSYNPRDGTFTEKGKGCYSAVLYVESFLSPKDLLSHSE